MRVQAGTDCAVRVDAVTYWIAAQLKTPVQIDQSMASVPLFIERGSFFCLLCPPPPTSPSTSLHLTLLITVHTKDNYQLRFTCADDLTCKGLLTWLNEYIMVPLQSKAWWEEKGRWCGMVTFYCCSRRACEGCCREIDLGKHQHQYPRTHMQQIWKCME